MQDTDQYLGKTLEEVNQMCSTVRVMTEDGEHFVLTMDYRPERLNVELENGIVVDARWG
jgi:hypothetical protein